MSSSRLQPLIINPIVDSSGNMPTGDIPNSPFVKKDIPTINFSYTLNGLEDKLRNIKITNSQSDFLDQIQQILSLYDDSELHYNHELVLFVMNEVERYILKSKSGDSKKQLTIECCKKYFDNNTEILEVIIEILFPQVKQVKFIKRQGLKLIRFFLKIVQSQKLTN